MHSLIFLSCSAIFLASSIIAFNSSSVNLFLSFSITTLLDLPIDSSVAVTCSIPSASISNFTKILGIPRGNGGIPVSSNVPINVLSLVSCRSPSNTLTVTPGWLSEYVVNVCSLEIGIVELRSINLVITPPAVSIPRDNGAVSKIAIR